MPRLLVVHHTVSPALDELLQSVLGGAADPELSAVEVLSKPALITTAVDVLQADGFVLGTSANLGYMSGALKHFFDTVYYPCLETTRGRPYGLYVHGNNDVDGAVTAVRKITAGLAWQQVADPVRVIGAPSAGDRADCRELGGVLAATLF